MAIDQQSGNIFFVDDDFQNIFVMNMTRYEKQVKNTIIRICIYRFVSFNWTQVPQLTPVTSSLFHWAF